MKGFKHYLLTALFAVVLIGCKAGASEGTATITTGAERTTEYLPMLKGKRVALLVNQTAIVGNTHLVDTLLSLGVDVRKIFAPEHGFRGAADAGAHVKDTTDPVSGKPIISLYGNKKNPSADDLSGVDIVIFDIQDAGARFYTFISSLHYLMQACAENNKTLLVLDRPNPNGWYVDGPVRQKGFESFVGLDPIPVVHGLTVGEYARMVNGEGWLDGGKTCDLKVITCSKYDHKTHYTLPVKPSPNLPNSTAIYLYPSICYFEGTQVSLARGTTFPFQAIGAPEVSIKTFSFTPKPMPGANNPPRLNEVCYGMDLRKVATDKPGIDLSYLLKMYNAFSDKSKFFLANNFFDKLAGTDALRKQIIEGKTEKEIKSTWQADLQAYKAMRKKYLLYPDFE